MTLSCAENNFSQHSSADCLAQLLLEFSVSMWQKQNTVVWSHSTKTLPQALRGRGWGALKNKTSPLFSAEWTEACGPHAPLTEGSFILSTPPTPFKAPATFSQMPFQQPVTALPFLCPPQAPSSHTHPRLSLPIKYSSLTGIKGAMRFKDYHMPLIVWLPCFWSAVHARPQIYSSSHFLSVMLSVDSFTVWLRCAVWNDLWTGTKRHGKVSGDVTLTQYCPLVCISNENYACFVCDVQNVNVFHDTDSKDWNKTK